MLHRRFLAAGFVVVLFATSLSGEELTVRKGETAPVPASFERSFTLELDGEFTAERVPRWTARRYVYDEAGKSDSLDLFEKGRLRLGNREIYFLTAAKGKIRNPGGDKDHYAEVGTFQGRHKVRISYDRASSRCRVWIDDSLEGDFGLEIRKTEKVGRLLFVGFEGTVRILEGAEVPGGLDAVLAAGPAAPAMTASNPGTRTVTAASDGDLRVTAKLSTYGAARLSVTIARNGQVRRWLLWQRRGAEDASPLQVDGKPRLDSMFERRPGDFSPRDAEEVTPVLRGDRITFELIGDFGDGTPVLRYALP